MFERDKYLIFFFAVGILRVFRNQLLAQDSIESLLKFATSNAMKINDLNILANVYYESVTLRSNTPVSFVKLVSRLGLFKADFIISNEELAAIDTF